MHKESSPRRLAAVAAVTALLLAGCADGSSDGEGSGRQTLTFWGWSDMSKPVARWNKTHPGIHVKFQAITSNFYPKLQAALTGKSGAPDITQVDYPNLTSTIIAGNLKDVTAETRDLKGQFKPAVWDQVVVDGSCCRSSSSTTSRCGRSPSGSTPGSSTR
ncbi:extracellular solute-binding protein [Streptomyces botrytidirepellens]|uniref:Extracellular solute-binding protein n=1 Tax=Streptomyces botrytidirepellens TaxID=2486417 RepID=A0A3M8TKQ0_9ACTN|nr:extracellular solute-binding protein [Streptomyces botrytidirepellens]RNF92626.1 extracellular solute-binding protein [Streptomyces botrytidirepellens]